MLPLLVPSALRLSDMDYLIVQKYIRAPPFRYGLFNSTKIYVFLRRTKMSRKKSLRGLAFFLFVIDLSGELGPIFKDPCSNNFLLWHDCLLCTRTKVPSTKWSTGDNFVLP